LSVTNIAFWFTKWLLALLLSDKICEPALFDCNSIILLNSKNNILIINIFILIFEKYRDIIIEENV
jgi:hypothetical protein